jgi:hypothetical protein
MGHHERSEYPLQTKRAKLEQSEGEEEWGARDDGKEEVRGRLGAKQRMEVTPQP